MKILLYSMLGTSLVCLAAPWFPLLQEFEAESRAKSLTWQDSLPEDVRESILWCADHEEGSLFDWANQQKSGNGGGGVFTTGTSAEAIAKIDATRPLTGKYCASTTIHNAIQSQNGSKAVRLMRWTDKPWNQGGKLFPKSAYYAVWMRLDHNYVVRNPASPSGGWWNVFQFKSDDEDGQSQPVWVLNIGNQKTTDKMYFYLYSKHNQPASISQVNPVPLPIPVGRWFHVEALYVQSTNNTTDGSLSVWQDGQLILSVKNVKTVLTPKTIWGVGNYTDHVGGGEKPGTASIYFDDATVSTKPTHPYVAKMLNQQQ